ncbi:hypothetical protein QHH11_08200 [Aphanizomenon sp. PH219]|nr:hypothetical protein [Aphanizomenon sp. 202]MDK2459119.1 hypothetical protein [Aphanizomenon sp. PH219]
MNKIILDPTGLYQPLTDYIAITTEVEWLKYFTLEDENYWIKGKTLCNWTEEWLRVWNKSDLIIEKKQVPRPKLAAIFSHLSIPDDWDDQYILKLATQLDSYTSNHPLESLLADITNTEESFWLIDNLSIEHLAKWLCLQIPQSYQIFEDVWKHKISQNHNHDQEIIGSHGGLFPEEVVVGFSVLSQSLKRNPVIVTCSGEGKPQQPGELIITIHNHNVVSLTNLCLYINELREFKTGKILDITIKPHDKIIHKIFVGEYPELPPNKNEATIQLSGKLTFLFANNDSEESNIDLKSFITIQQIFSSGFQGDLDDF